MVVEIRCHSRTLCEEKRAWTALAVRARAPHDLIKLGLGLAQIYI